MTIDPIGPVPAAGVYRVIRGGSWYREELLARAAGRNDNGPGYRNSASGFRLTVTLPCKTTTPVVQ